MKAKQLGEAFYLLSPFREAEAGLEYSVGEELAINLLASCNVYRLSTTCHALFFSTPVDVMAGLKGLGYLFQCAAHTCSKGCLGVY